MKESDADSSSLVSVTVDALKQAAITAFQGAYGSVVLHSPSGRYCSHGNTRWVASAPRNGSGNSERSAFCNQVQKGPRVASPIISKTTPLLSCHRYGEILPPGANQSCHLNGSGLDCQIQRSAAVWRLRSEQQAVRCGLPVS